MFNDFYFLFWSLTLFFKRGGGKVDSPLQNFDKASYNFYSVQHKCEGWQFVQNSIIFFTGYVNLRKKKSMF